MRVGNYDLPVGYDRTIDGVRFQRLPNHRRAIHGDTVYVAQPIGAWAHADGRPTTLGVDMDLDRRWMAARAQWLSELDGGGR